MTNELKTNLDWRLILLLVFIAAGVGMMILIPDLFDRGVRESPEYRANREKIENMTSSERERLERRIERFYEEKSEEEREAMRKLHRDLDRQPDEEEKELKAVMKRYNDLLTSLTPVEREKFRKTFRETESVDERLNLVEQTIQKEEDRRFVSSLRGRWRNIIEKTPAAKRPALIAKLRESERSRSRSRRRSRGRRFNWLSVPELDAVIAFIEKIAPLDAVVREQLKEMSPNRRRLNVMIFAMQNNREQRADKMTGFLEDERLAPAIESSDLDSDLKEKLEKARRSPWNRRYGILGLITGSLYHERRQRRGNPNEVELNEFLSTMNEEERDRIMKYRGAEKRFHLKREYLDGGDDSRDYGDFRNEVRQTLFRFGGPRGKGPGRSRNRKPPNGKKKFPPNRNGGRQSRSRSGE